MANVMDAQHFYLDKVTIIPSHKSYLHMIDVPKNTTLTAENVEISYGHLSPFQRSSVIVIQHHLKALIWFYEEQNTAWLRIPESLALFHMYQLSKKDGVHIFKVLSGESVVIVQKGILIGQRHSKKGFTAREYDYFLREFGFQNREIFYQSHEISFKLHMIPLQVLKSCLSYELRHKQWAQMLIHYGAYPLLGSALVLSLGLIIEKEMLETRVKEYKSTYSELRRDNHTLRVETEELNEAVNRYRTLEKLREEKGKKLTLFNDLAPFLKGMKIELIKIINEEAYLIIIGTDKLSIVEQLLESNLFEDVKVDSTFSINKGEAIKVRLKAVLK